MELGHHMKDLSPPVGVDFVFFDGEEYIFDNKNDQYFFGSRYFAAAYRAERPEVHLHRRGPARHDRRQEPAFPEGNELGCASGPARERDLADRRGAEVHGFQPGLGPEVLDDHIALNEAGIPAVDIIDFGYPHWHRLSDVPENCSPEGLEQVAQVLATWLRRQ